MTPLQLAKGIKSFLEDRMAHYDEEYTFGEQFDSEGEYIEDIKKIGVYTLRLPIVKTAAERRSLSPSIVIRPYEVRDEEDQTVVKVFVAVTVHDSETEAGAEVIYHLVEFIRHELLAHNPVGMKWNVRNGSMITTIPDEQPYPEWWGIVDFEVNIPQPEWTPPGVFD